MPLNSFSLNKQWRTAGPNGETLYSLKIQVGLEYFIIAVTHLNINNWQKIQKWDWIFNTEFLESHKIYVFVFVVGYVCLRLQNLESKLYHQLHWNWNMASGDTTWESTLFLRSRKQVISRLDTP